MSSGKEANDLQQERRKARASLSMEGCSGVGFLRCFCVAKAFSGAERCRVSGACLRLEV